MLDLFCFDYIIKLTMETLAAEVVIPPEDDLDIDQMWLLVGERAGFTPEQFGAMWRDSQTWYTDWPFHNFLHARETLWEVARLADLCEQNGIVVNRKALVAAAVFHDAGYHLDHRDYGNLDKETFSAAILGTHQERYGLGTDDALIAQKAILATKAGAAVYDIHDKILVRADLANIAGRYEEDFSRKFDLLRQEKAIEKNGAVSILDFTIDSVKILGLYISEDLDLGPFDPAIDRTNAFKLHATRNLRRLIRDTARQQGLTIADCLVRIDNAKIIKLLGYRLPRRLLQDDDKLDA